MVFMYVEKVIFRLTDNCNLECGHCCYESGHGGETMSFENIKKVIYNVPRNVGNLVFSGGEVFTIKDKLYKTLDFVNQNRDSLFSKETLISVQSNCYWVLDKESLEKVLGGLDDFGVNYLGCSIDGEFHREQGLDVDKIKRIFENVDSPMLCFSDEGRIYPFGRTKNLDSEYICDKHVCDFSEKYTKNFMLFIVNPDGSVSPCCWNAFSIGSAIEKPIEELFENALNNTLIRKIAENGPDVPEEYHNICAVCKEMDLRGFEPR